VPHALLQSPDYARQIILATWEKLAQAEVDRRVQACRRRQDVLDAGPHGRPLHLSAVIDESVLHRRVLAADDEQDAAIRRGQLEHLIAAAARPNVNIQVLPFAAGLPPVTAGSFSILDSLATGAPDVVYLENKTRVFFIDAETEVHRYTQAFDYLSTQALTPQASIDLIEQTLRSLPG
jgi:hypothetical protein